MLHMQRRPSLFAEVDKDIRARHWYRQRFDACPHFMFFLGDAHTSRIQHTPYPFGQKIAYAGFSRNRADWYHSTDELWKTANQIIEAAKVDPAISQTMQKAFQPHAEAFYALCEEIESMDISTHSDTSLLELYQTFADVYTNKLLASPLIDGFALVTDDLIAKKLRSHLEIRGEGTRFIEVFEILTAPVFTSFLAEEEAALLRLALNTAPNSDERERGLDLHQKAFFWMQNNYVSDHLLDKVFFHQRLSKIDSAHAKERLQVLAVHAQNHQVQKSALIKEIDLPQDLQTLLRITDDFAAWQDERKKGTFFATHALTLILKEIAKRTGYALQELAYALPPEMEQIMKKEISSSELQTRWEYCMVLWTADQYDVTTDQALIQELDRIGTGETDTSLELKGFPASRGVATGPVRVIESAQDIQRVEEGDILVAVMTRPDYMSGMKKAAGFVTDEGGITCHAAIVAREMNKPCVIGTKHASKVLKDGMIVEVDANKGVVRVL